MSLGLITVASVVFGIVINNLLTPRMAQQVVRLDEENRLFKLSREMNGLSESQIREQLAAPGLEHLSLSATSGTKSEAIMVPIPNSELVLVSHRPLTLPEARKAVVFPNERQFIALILTIVLLYFVASKLAAYVSKPLQELTNAAKALADGKRDVAVPIPAEAELAELAKSFNRMAEELSQRETELEQALAAKELIFATTSHELRTPLTVILGYCQMLEDGLKGQLTEDQIEIVGVVRRNADALLQQVETLLTLSQLRARSLPFERESVDMVLLVEQALDGLEGLAQQKGLELTSEFLSGAVEVLVDPRAAERIVMNLVANAIKFTQSGGIQVAVERQEKNGILRVVDTGPGIADAFLPKLFLEFARGPETEGVEGNGLGLALSKQLAESMGGSVELESTSASGSSFVWRTPLEEIV